jgi:hypothetical protein
MKFPMRITTPEPELSPGIRVTTKAVTIHTGVVVTAICGCVLWVGRLAVSENAKIKTELQQVKDAQLETKVEVKALRDSVERLWTQSNIRNASTN